MDADVDVVVDVVADVVVDVVVVDAGSGRRTVSGGSCSTTRRRVSITTTRQRSAPSGTDRTTVTSSHWPNSRFGLHFMSLLSSLFTSLLSS